MQSEPKRPVLRYFGGKWMLAPWIIAHLPKHRVYVEPYGGSASVLLRKRRCYGEVYNDLDREVVGLFRVLRSDRADELREAVRNTPFAREEFELAREPATDDLERARRLIVRSFLGHGSNAHNPAISTGFRANSHRSGSSAATDWMRYPDTLELLRERLSGVVIENRPALEVIEQHDNPHTLFYCDPPYMQRTRQRAYHCYAHEMTDEDHVQMLEALKSVKGMVVLSGYPCDLYDSSLEGWTRVERQALADGAGERTEVLWLNEAADTVRQTRMLFDG